MKRRLIIKTFRCFCAMLLLCIVVCSMASCNTEGKSAYELAVENGFEGTVEEWLASLSAANTDGEGEVTAKDGLSAYEIAVKNGFKGSEKKWLASLKSESGSASDKGYVIVTDYLEANTGADVSNQIQSIINMYPNRTIYFPDGEYIISSPIQTHGDPNLSVSLELSNYAVIKASNAWSSDEAMIRLGSLDQVNDIHTNGSNYYLSGGIIDGSGVAKGVAIEGGRETAVRNVSIKNTSLGLHIKRGVNAGSSDADIDTVNIVGNGMAESIGVLIDAADNTLTNMRIANVEIGVKLLGAGNYLRNIHPLFLFDKGTARYEESFGFWDKGGNWFDFCYSDQFQTGFRVGWSSVYQTCRAYWYSDRGGVQTGFWATNDTNEGRFGSMLLNCDVNFKHPNTVNSYLKVDTPGGRGIVEYPTLDIPYNYDNTYKDYLVGRETYY